MMSEEARLAEVRATRDAARAVVSAEYAQVKADLAARGIGGRIIDEAKVRADHVAAETADLAYEQRSIIAGTVGAVALWLMRKPIMSGARRVGSKLQRLGKNLVSR